MDPDRSSQQSQSLYSCLDFPCFAVHLASHFQVFKELLKGRLVGLAAPKDPCQLLEQHDYSIPCSCNDLEETEGIDWIVADEEQHVLL